MSPRLLALVALAAYLATLAVGANAVPTGADESGYFNHARLLTAGTLHAPQRVLPGVQAEHFSDYLYVPGGFIPARGNLIPTYPAGLPLLLAGAQFLVGWNQAGNLVMLLHAAAGIVLIFALARAMGLSRTLALLATTSLACSALYVKHSWEAMSDLPACVWTTAAGLAAWRARERTPWAIAAGAALAVAVLIRPSDLLLAGAIAVAWYPAAGAAAPLRRMVLQWLALAAGALPGAAVYCIHSRLAYGHPLSSGYGDFRQLFSVSCLGPGVLAYLRWLPPLFLPALPGLFLLPFFAGRHRAAGFLLVWAGAFLGFYAPYRYTAESWWYLRFILPAAPALIVGSLWSLRRLWPRIERHSGALLGLIVLAEGIWIETLHVRSIPRHASDYTETCAWLRAHAPADAAVIGFQTTGALYFSTPDTVIRLDQLSTKNFPEIAAAAARAGRPLYAALFPEEIPAFRSACAPDQWTRLIQFGHISLWQHHPPP